MGSSNLPVPCWQFDTFQSTKFPIITYSFGVNQQDAPIYSHVVMMIRQFWILLPWKPRNGCTRYDIYLSSKLQGCMINESNPFILLLITRVTWRDCISIVSSSSNSFRASSLDEWLFLRKLYQYIMNGKIFLILILIWLTLLVREGECWFEGLHLRVLHVAVYTATMQFYT